QSAFVTKLPENLRESRLAQTLLGTRQRELRTFSLGIGLAASQTTSAVLRLSPAVNRVFPALSSFGRSVRSAKYESKLKARRLFSNIQKLLADAVGTEKLQFIETHLSGPLKIISDAPIEWLPINGLPLSLRYECSRLNSTPGNLLMSLL